MISKLLEIWIIMILSLAPIHCLLSFLSAAPFANMD